MIIIGIEGCVHTGHDLDQPKLYLNLIVMFVLQNKAET